MGGLPSKNTKEDPKMSSFALFFSTFVNFTAAVTPTILTAKVAQLLTESFSCKTKITSENVKILMEEKRKKMPLLITLKTRMTLAFSNYLSVLPRWQLWTALPKGASSGTFGTYRLGSHIRHSLD